MTTGRRRRNVIAEVEAEYGEPFWDVVKSYADSGESIPSTGGILGYSCPSAFRRLVLAHGKQDWFVRGQGQGNAWRAFNEDRKGVCTPAKREALRKATAASAAREDVIRFEVNGITDTIAGHARRYGVNVATAYQRRHRGWDIVKAVTTPKVDPRPRYNRRNHPWNQ